MQRRRLNRHPHPPRVSAPLALAERVGKYRGMDSQRMGGGHDREPADHLRVVRADGPGNETAPVMAHEDGVRLTERADKAGGVRGRGHKIVSARWLVAATITAQVSRYRPKAGL